MPVATWQYPQLRLLANGNLINGAFTVDATSNNHYASDTISGEISLTRDPAFGIAWFDAQTDITIDVQMSTTKIPSWTSITVATVDQLDWDVSTLSIRFDGRDLTAKFIDAKTQETFANQTSSEVVTTLAARHGLQASVTPTKTLVGAYYAADHDRITMGSMSKQTTEWDLITNLAQEEGFDVWVQGNTIYFMPEQSSVNPPFSILYSPPVAGIAYPTLNVIDLKCHRSLTLAKDISVTVKSTNLKTGTAYVRTVKGAGAKSAGAAKSDTQNYVFKKPGLTPDQALKFAQMKLAELSAHERVIEFDLPGELTLTPRDKIAVSGTGTGFDTTYFIDHISRSMSFEDGFKEHIRAKNTPTKTETTIS